jgi:hypothetical protein
LKAIHHHKTPYSSLLYSLRIRFRRFARIQWTGSDKEKVGCQKYRAIGIAGTRRSDSDRRNTEQE